MWLRIIFATVIIALIGKYCLKTYLPLVNFDWENSIILSIILGIFMTFFSSLSLLIPNNISLVKKGICIIPVKGERIYLYDNIKLIIIDKKEEFSILIFDYDMTQKILPLSNKVEIEDIISFLDSKGVKTENKMACFRLR